MTFSILAYDEKTGRLGGAATTGSLCVGGWVLRGDSRSGMSASQGTSPSTIWGEDVLEMMRGGMDAASAVAKTVDGDAGKSHRQLTAIDRHGGAGAFTGEDSIDASGHRCGQNLVVAGNMLSDAGVLDAVMDAFQSSTGELAERLLAALDAGQTVGGDSRGLMSAALLIVGHDYAPLSLRIDHSDTPLDDLRRLYERSQSKPYVDWHRVVPTRKEPQRGE